jgi:superfamily II DNA or RNA helicase
VNIVITNSNIRIQHPTDEIKSDLIKQLTFKDKSKEYQLNKMAHNPYTRNSKAYFELKKQIYQCLLIESNDEISFPSGLAHLIEHLPHEDLRKDTGKTISLPWKSASKAIQLRDYQRTAVDKCLLVHRGIINMATGLGKSKTLIVLIKELKKKALIVAPSKGIANQLYDELCELFGKERVGFYGSGKKKINDITVGIAQTVTNHIKDFQKADLGMVAIDESHHSAATTFHAILEGLSNVGRIYGLTATAYRSDGKDILLNATCGMPVVEYDAAWGIANGHLAQPIFIIRKIKTNAHDYNDKLMAYKSHVLNSNEITNRIKEDATKMIKVGHPTLIIVDTIEHGRDLSKYLGVPFATGEDKNSASYINQFNEGKVLALVGTEGSLSEGIDTRKTECLILAQFTVAKGAVLQAVGRGLRKQDKKTHCYILDYWPISSTMLSRHAKRRVEYYQEITNQVKII